MILLLIFNKAVQNSDFGSRLDSFQYYQIVNFCILLIFNVL